MPNPGIDLCPNCREKWIDLCPNCREKWIDRCPNCRENWIDLCPNCREKWIDLAEKVEMGLTWIDHDTIEQPVEEVEVSISCISYPYIIFTEKSQTLVTTFPSLKGQCHEIFWHFFIS